MRGTRWSTGRIRLIAVAAVACILLAESSAADDTSYSVGVAKVDITPDHPVRLHGFGGRRTESEGITQRIWAKALAVGTDAEKPVILLTVDNLGVRMSMVDEVAARLKKKAAIERHRIALTFTHSHTTPKTTGSADTIFSSPIPPDHQQRIDRYTAELTDALERVALDALANRKPAKLQWAVGKVGFAKNRRTEGGPVDHDLPTLVVKDADGSIRAVYVTYACHCVTLSDNKISGDWAGYAQEVIEHNHPGAIALVSIGCGSDSNPSSGVTGSNIAAAAEQGGEIASEVERLLRGPLKPITGLVSGTLRKIELPLNPLPARSELETLAANDTPEGFNAKYQLARLDRGEALPTALDYPIQSVVFGDSLAMVFLAGEVCVDYSLRLKQELDADRIWLHGYANDFCAYIPSERLVTEGGYGGGAETVYFALPATLQAGLEQKIVTEVRRQLPPNYLQQDAKKSTRLKPIPPLEALTAIELRNGLVAELVAAEPLVTDPVAIDFGPDGKLWVAEMNDYSREVDELFDQNGAVKLLEDQDGGGTFETATLFVSGLRFPTDVKVWRQGVIVCDAPDVIYFEDTNGDGRADLRKVLLTGFATHNAQARVNSLRWGLDNWVHGSCGLFGGSIRSFSGKTLELGGRDFRFHPETGEIEPVAGRTQQGRVRDDWDNWFGCENGVLCKHYPLLDHYIARNPFVVSPSAEQNVLIGEDPVQLYPIAQPVLFKESGPPGRPTSACGLEIYRDELLGAEFYGNAFVAEPVNQLVHRRVLSPSGITFKAQRASDESQREFLASRDPWFRPVQIRTGLDGCLWIVDMCRYVIEHPRFIPQDTLESLDVRAGNAAGRIFRVRPKNVRPRPAQHLRELSTADLVMAIDSPNGPQRDLVQQLLIERADRAATPLLEKLVATGERPTTRLQSLCALEGLGALNEQVVLRALKDPSPELIRHAIRLSELFLDSSPSVFAAVTKLVEVDAPEIQMQLAYSLGESHDPLAAKLLAELAWRHRADEYLVAAVLSSVDAQNSMSVLKNLATKIADEDLSPPLRHAIVTMATKLGGPVHVKETLHALRGSQDASYEAAELVLVAELLESCSAEIRDELQRDRKIKEVLAHTVEAARDVLRDDEAGEKTILAAMRLLATSAASEEDFSSEISQLLGPRSSPAVQQAALQFLGGTSNHETAEMLFANWSTYTPALRKQALDLAFSRQELIPSLLEALEQRTIIPTDLDALQRQRLLQHGDASIRAAASAAIAGDMNADRQRVIDSYTEAVDLSGMANRGRKVFRKHCANCHRLEEHGHAVGPDLAALTNRTTKALLEDLFDPNRSLDERYQTYTAITDEGNVYVGILTDEAANSITLGDQDGKQHTLLRGSLEEFRNNRVSLMPEGFERDLSTTDVSDLLAYLDSQREPPKQFPGNQPELVRPRSDGSLWLLATNCEIYGPSIVFEPQLKNVGYWHSANDYVAWNVQLPTWGEYSVFLEAACADDSRGNTALIEGFDAPLVTTVTGTGSWERYRIVHVGKARLAKGTNRVLVRPEGTLRNALMDLRAMYLVPVVDEGSSQLASIGSETSEDAAGKIAVLLQGLAVGTPGEYERIPAIFEEAIAAGRRDSAPELSRLLELSVPRAKQPLRHWQAVVIGGGIINGLSQRGKWPRDRLMELLKADDALLKRWERCVELAAVMADDETVRTGTRYDALRILGAGRFEDRGPQLIRYLQPAAHHELQMGAVSAMADIKHESATDALLHHFANYNAGNRELAIAGLMRTESGVSALLSALEAGKISPTAIGAEFVKKLRRSNNPALRSRTEAVFSVPGEESTRARD